MQVRKIKAINRYKSFADFRWEKFCKNKNQEESVLEKFTIIFGENGSGKSAICDVLKSVSQNQEFKNISPTSAEIEINNSGNTQIYKYENESWERQTNKKSFLFFDVEFINANVHTHGVRSNNLKQGGHTQNAGKLIINLDERANNLKETVYKKKGKLEELQSSCADVLEKKFTEKDKEFFDAYKDTDDKTKQEKLTKFQEELEILTTDLSRLEKVKNKHASINRLSAVNQVVFSNSLSPKETFSELFARQIKEKAQDKTDEAIKTHFTKYKQFIEYATGYIPENYVDENCPLCMQPLRNAAEVIKWSSSKK